MLRTRMAKRDTKSTSPETPSPALAPLEADFERGDFAQLRDQLARLPEAEQKNARAGQLRAAVSVDIAHAVVLALCFAALLAIAAQYLG